MAATALQSISYPLQVRPSGGNGTWYTLVCLENYSVPLARATNVAETFCGPFTGLGAATFSFTGSAVCNATPAATEVTMTDMVNWLLNITLLDARAEAPVGGGSTGDDLFVEGNVYVTAVEPQFSTGQVVKFTFTLSGTGLFTNVISS